MWLKAVASRPISSSVVGSIRWFHSPRASAAAPSASCCTGLEMRRAMTAAAQAAASIVTIVSPASSTRVRRICASIRCFESPTRTVPQRAPFTKTGAAKS